METTVETRTVLPFVTGAGPVSAAQAAAVMRAVSAIASQDMARGVISGVHVEPHNDGVRFTATDSYRLLTVTIGGDGTGATRTFDPFTLSAKELAAAAKNVKKSETCSIEYVPGDSAATFSNGVDSFRVPTIDGTFANWRRLVPDSGEWPAAGDTVNVNPVLLSGLLDSFAMIAAGGTPKRDAVLTVTFGKIDPAKPSLITATGDAFTATGLIMPLRK